MSERSDKPNLLSRALDWVVRLRRSDWRTKIPKPLRRLGYRLLPQGRLRRQTWKAEYDSLMQQVEPAPPRTAVKLGILKDIAFRHGNYEAACLELGVPYEVVDIFADNWIDRVTESGCEVFMAWPTHVHSVAKRIFDDRTRILTTELGRTVFPSYEALWLYESKRRQANWLAAHGFPHPRTWLFADRESAMDFVERADYPLVFKADLGSTARGVEIVRTRRHARRLVERSFDKGYLSYRRDPRDREWGSVILQQCIERAKEWRMVRVGDSYFGHRKLRKGQFHSGSKLVAWDRPSGMLLDLLKQVTRAGPFLSMNVDVLEDAEGQYYINEMQALFGQKHEHQMIIDGHPGRFVSGEPAGDWRFEAGSFCGHRMCDERTRVALRITGEHLKQSVGA